MPRFYEEAALLLLYVVGQGMVLNTPLVDQKRILKRLADALDVVAAQSLTDADAAEIILDAFQKYWLGRYDPAKRDKLIAVIGTFVGNTPALRVRAR